MIYNVARVRKLFAQFQVDICKTKKDTSAHAQLRSKTCGKNQEVIYKISSRYMQK